MKKSLLLIIVMMLPMVVNADPVEIKGIYYNLVKKAKSAEVTSNPNKYSGNIEIPSTVDYDGTVYKVIGIDEHAFFDCGDLTSIVLGNNVTTIKYEAFAWCRKLTDITIPPRVQTIGDWAFNDCISLENVYAFDLSAWCSINFGGNPLEYAQNLYINGELITRVNIPDNVTTIGNAAFVNYSRLETVTIPSSVTSIGNYAFDGTSITSISIPSSVISIGEGAFANCTNLTTASLPNTLQYIDMNLFSGCSKLSTIAMPNNIYNIRWGAFNGCSSLTSIVIPNSVKWIGDYAFANCSNLKSITLPSSLESLSLCSFSNCIELTDLYCYAEHVPTTAAEVFEGSYIEYATLHVPESSMNDYSLVEPWKNFKSIVSTEGTTPTTPKCSKPTISYVEGQLQFTCKTKKVEFVSEIKDEDVKKHYDATIPLTRTYTISVYATRSGYNDSNVATATLCWIEAEPTIGSITTGINEIPSHAVLIQNNGGKLSLTGAIEGKTISVYNLSGQLLGSATAASGTTTISTSLSASDTCIVKIGDKSVKVIVR